MVRAGHHQQVKILGVFHEFSEETVSNGFPIREGANPPG
jgi:hypothetical protein